MDYPEEGVKSINFHLKRIDSTLTFKELNTLLIHVAISDNSNDVELILHIFWSDNSSTFFSSETLRT